MARSWLNNWPSLGPAGPRVIRYAGLVTSLVLACVGGLALSPTARGDTRYYQHSFFDNSTTSISGENYFYSSGTASAPSALELVDRKLPVEKKIFLTPPNALRLAWQSVPEGGWDAEIRVMEFRNRHIHFEGDTLYFWVYSQDAIAADDLGRCGGKFFRAAELGCGQRGCTGRALVPSTSSAAAIRHRFDPRIFRA
jgi:hypothetical protein